MSNIYRDVTLNQVSEQDIGKTIRVAGWVENIRDHGGVSFIDLRDMYAVMQIVIRDGKLLEGIRKEQADRKSTRLNSSHPSSSRMPSSA